MLSLLIYQRDLLSEDTPIKYTLRNHDHQNVTSNKAKSDNSVPLGTSANVD